MLYRLLYQGLYLSHPQLSVLNVTQYITFRTAAASLSAHGWSASCASFKSAR